MSIKDVIKTLFSNLSEVHILLPVFQTMIIALAVALIFGLLICLIYNKFYRGVVYNRSFAVTLVGMCVMTAMVTLAIQHECCNISRHGRRAQYRQIPYSGQGAS